MIDMTGRILRRRGVAASLVLALALPGAVSAAPYQVRGPGGRSCHAWTEYRASSPLPGVMEGWVTGFLTAMNAMSAANGAGPDLAVGMDDAAVASWIDTYCEDHPDDRLATAALTLASELEKPPGRPAAPPPAH
jgi:hypothetical protein